MNASATALPGYRTHGWGAAKVIVLHDWLSDGSSYEPMLPYLDPSLVQWVFMDLRGYGLSRGLPGRHTLVEAANDVLTLADSLKWQRFNLVGHSMTGMVVQKVASLARDRINSLVGITPVSAHGQKLEPDVVKMLKDEACDRTGGRILRLIWGDRLSETWIEYKLRRWRETSDATACSDYVDMFSGPGFSDEIAGFELPVMVVAGEHDAGSFAPSALRTDFAPLYPKLVVETIPSSGHYPMQETPALLATILERFVVHAYAERLVLA